MRKARYRLFVGMCIAIVVITLATFIRSETTRVEVKRATLCKQGEPRECRQLLDLLLRTATPKQKRLLREAAKRNVRLAVPRNVGRAVPSPDLKRRTPKQSVPQPNRPERMTKRQPTKTAPKPEPPRTSSETRTEPAPSPPEPSPTPTTPTTPTLPGVPPLPTPPLPIP